MNKKPLSKEQQSEILIKSLGDIVVKSLFNNENSVVNEGIDKLSEIALDFLDLKSQDEEKYAVQRNILFTKSASKNQYVSYVANEFYRIYDIAIRNRNSAVCQYLFFKLIKIVDKVMSGKNNLAILEELIDTRNVSGSILWKFTESALDYGSDLEKNIVIQHLVTFPQQAILGWKYAADYLNEFLEYHVYRINKLIIDKNDFKLFTQEIDLWSTSLQFSDPFGMAEDISNDLFPYYFEIYDEEINKKCERLQFLITRECVRDFEKVSEFHEQLEVYRKLILNKITDQTQIDSVNKKFLNIGNKANEFYVCSKLYGTFFRISGYLIFKGQEYSNYVKELWYHTKPENSQIRITNTTPVSESIEWNTMYVMYRGKGSKIFDEFELFDSFQDLESYYYRYYALTLLKLCKIFQLPPELQITSWKNKDEKYKPEFYYEISKILPTKKFIQGLDEVSKLTTLLSIIRLDQKSIQDKIKEIREKLLELEKKQIDVAKDIVVISQVSSSLIEEVKQNIIMKYDDDSHSKNISLVTYDENLPPADCQSISTCYEIPREYLIESKFSSSSLSDSSPVSELAKQETATIYNTIQSKIVVKSENDPDFVKQIRSAMEILRSNGLTPDMIFLPLKVKFELEDKLHLSFMLKKTITIDKTPLHIINSYPQFDFTEIIVFDSHGLQLSYKSSSQADKISIEVLEEEEGNIINFACKMLMSVKILNTKAFVRIMNESVIPLAKK